MIYSLLQKTLSNIQGVKCLEEEQTIRIAYSGNYLTSKPLYYAVNGIDVIFSYDFFEIVACYQEHNELIINKGILPFFLDKGYAPFDYTFVEHIFKLPNMTEIIIDKESLKLSYELCWCCNEIQNDISDCELIEKSIIDCLDPKRKTVILFSGGYDSTLIALIAKDYCGSGNIELVTGRMVGTNFIPNKLDAKYSKDIACALGIDMHMIDVNVDQLNQNDIDSIILNQPNTAHFSLVFGGIRDSYKEVDCNFISGQQADSILNFGSTSFIRFNKGRLEGSGELLRRIFYLSNFKMAELVFKILNRKLAEKRVQLALMCGYKKLPIIKDLNLYNNYVALYDSFSFKYKNREILSSSFHLFYLFTHLSGSDASGVLSNFSSIKYPLPFNSIKLIWHFVNKKYSFKEKWIPKKPIMDNLKKNKLIWEELKLRPNTPNSSYLDVFYHIADKLKLRSYYEKSVDKYKLDLPFCYNSYHLFRCLDRIYEKK